MTTLADTLSGSGTTQTAWGQLDQLLTCAICLDRYRNPKLLPCQHTFCMEPCLEGLIDYIRRQIKCPECRAEHRIPYQGIQGFPTNVTLMRFLELHFEVSGESPDPTPTVRERCGVCSEKAYLGHCAHCDKKVCPDCKEAHLDILKREIARINNQVRRGLHRLQDALAQSEKSVHHLQQNCTNVAQEVDEVYGRLQKDLKEREETLKGEVKSFLQTELHNLTSLKDNLDVEVGNIQSNCELVEKHVNENSEWEDVELVDYKETFLKTLEFVRNFDPDQAEFNGRLKFQPGPDSELVHQGIAHFGELILNNPQFPTNTPAVTQTSQNLMRSKSDHRLATQFHRQEESRNFLGVGQRYSGHGSDNEGRDGRAPSPLSRRRPGESETGYRRMSTQPKDFEELERPSNRRYGREFGGSWREDDSSGYRSRFGRDDMLREGSDPEVHPLRSVRFRQEQQDTVTPRERVFETEDAVRGPLSGIVRLMDSARVVRKLQLNEQREKQKAEEKLHPKPTPAPTPAPAPQPVRRPQRQLSEGDEIDRIKAQNKSAQSTSTPASATTTTTTTTTATTESQSRPLARRVAALQSRTSSQEDRTDTTPDSSATTTTSPARRRFGRQDDTPAEVTTPTPRVVVKQQSREDSSRDTSSSNPTSRQTSREEFKTPPSTPTRKLSVDQRSDSSKSDDKSSPSDDSSANKRRFFTRNQSYDRSTPFKPAAPTPITEPTSTTTRHHETTSGVSADNARDGQEDSSRSGSNPSSSQHPLAGRSQPTVSKPAEETSKSSDTTSSEESSSEESDSSEPTRVPTQPTPPARTPAPSTVAPKEEETTTSRYTPYRSRETTNAAKPAAVENKVDGRASPGRSRVSTFSSSRSSSVENPEEKKETPTRSKFVSRFLHKQSSAASDSDNESEDDEEKQAAEEAARDASIHALLARSAMARRESTGSALGTSRDSPSSLGSRSSMYAREREDASSSRKPGSYLQDKKETDGAENRYSSPTSRYLARSRTTAIEDDKDDSKYPSYSRYLTRSKSSAALGADRDDSPDDRRTGTGSDRFRKESRFSALRRNRLGRSRSSHDIALHGDDDDGDDRDAGSSSYRSPRTRDFTQRPNTPSHSYTPSSYSSNSYTPSSSSTYSPSSSSASTSSSLRPWSTPYKSSYLSRY